MPADPLHFVDTKKYNERLKATQENTGLTDAIRYRRGKYEWQKGGDCLYGFYLYWWLYGFCSG